MMMPNRSFSSSSYRYGFNGKENDNEVKGEGNELDYGVRTYDPRVGRFLSTDPLSKSYPYYTPYQFAGNKPIWALDLDGLEEYYYSAAWNERTGTIELKLDHIVDKKSFLGYSWTPGYEVNVTFKRSGDETNFTFTRLGRMVRGSGPGGIDLYQNKVADFEKFKSTTSSTKYASEEESFRAIDQQFYSDGAVALNFFGSTAKDFHDHGGAYTLNAKLNNEAASVHSGNTQTKLGGRALVVDENLSPQLITQLQERGYNVKAFPKGTLDADIITYANAKNAIVMTNNIKDFNKWGITTFKVSENMKTTEQIPNVIRAVENVSNKAGSNPSVIAPGKNISLAENK